MRTEVERKGMPTMVIESVFPPIPVRDFDWCAWRDGDEEGKKGWGRTAVEAVADLLEKEGEER